MVGGRASPPSLLPLRENFLGGRGIKDQPGYREAVDGIHELVVVDGLQDIAIDA
jgi:hypothetical protein